MIFVTVGTQSQNFNRLFKYVNELSLKERIIVQRGKSNFQFRPDILSFDYLNYEEMDDMIRKARVVVTHGGGGTIFKALRMNKRVIVVPRMRCYGEHINNHQVEIANFLKHRNLCLVALNKNDFLKSINEIDNYSFNKYISKEEEFLSKIEYYIDLLLRENE